MTRKNNRVLPYIMTNISPKFLKISPAELKVSSGNEIVDGQMDRQSDYYRAPTSSDAGP
jgi:hypothetical protein